MKRYKYLICISSFKRPLFLLGQIHRFYHQTYRNFDISVVVRGCDENVYNLIIDECKVYPNLKISQQDNKDQLNNLLDCIRQTDYSKYDFFCKVDDDDLYSLSYLENINKTLNKYDQNILGFSNRSPLQIIEQHNNQVKFKEKTHLHGNTLGFSQKMFIIYDQISKDIYNIKNICKKHNMKLEDPEKYINYPWEDSFISLCMDSLCDDKSVYIDINMPNQLYYCRLTNGSVLWRPS